MQLKSYHSPPRLALAFKRVILAAALVGWVGAGCRPEQSVAPPSPTASQGTARPLHLLVVGDEGLAKVAAREWEARADTRLEVVLATPREFAEELAGDDQRLAVDAVVCPTLFLGELSQRDLIVPLPQSLQAAEGLDQQDLFPLIRRREIRWGEQTMAVTFGASPLMLMFDADVLAALEVRTPETWPELDAVLKAWNSRQNDGQQTSVRSYALALPLAESWAARVFLARAAGYVSHPNQVSALFDWKAMEPLVDQPSFVTALDELVAESQLGPPEMLEWTPWDVWQAVRAGQCAVGIGWPARQSSADRQQDLVAVTVAELPGADRMYSRGDRRWDHRPPHERHVTLLAGSGRVGVVWRSSRRRGAAWKLLVTLSGAELGAGVSAASTVTAPYRRGQAGQVSAWLPKDASAALAAQYVSVLQATFSRRIALAVPQVTGGFAYVAALDRAVRQAVAGELTSEQALAETAKASREITVRVGDKAQAEAYLRSLGRAL